MAEISTGRGEPKFAEIEKLCSIFFPSQCRPRSASLEMGMPRRTTPLSLETTSWSLHPVAVEVGLHSSIRALMPRHDDATTIGLRLAMTIERVAAKCADIEAIQWRTGDNASPSSISIPVPVTVQTLGSKSLKKTVGLHVSRRTNETNQVEEQMPNPRPWVLEHRDKLQSVLSLWQYTLVERERAFQAICAMKAYAFRLAAPGREADYQLRKGTAYVRVVGYTSKLLTGNPDMDFYVLPIPQQAWLGKHVFEASSSMDVLGANHGVEVQISLAVSHNWPVFGAFVSEIS